MSTLFACLLSDRLLDVSGPDKKSYLHGQLTQDMNLVDDTHFLWAGHCNAKGKLWACHKVVKWQDSYLLLASAPESLRSEAELKKYGVFSKIEVSESPLKAIGLFGDDLSAVLGELGIAFDGNACDFGAGKAIRLDANRVILLVEDGFTLPGNITLLDDDGRWRILAIEAGEPSLVEEALDEYVPQMVNLQALGGISFKKGCYTGQETVARMKYLGKNKRAMFIVKGHADTALADNELEMRLGENWRRAGLLISRAYDSETQTQYGLAVLPNDLDADSVLRAKHAPDTELSLAPLPYSLTED